MVRRSPGFHKRATAVGDEFRHFDRGRRRGACLPEHQPGCIFANADAEQIDQRFEGGARRSRVGYQVALHGSLDSARIGRRLPMIGQDRVDESAEPGARQPAVQPVTAVPMGTVRPEIIAQRKGWKRPRIPRPRIDARGVDHASAIDGGLRIPAVLEAIR